MITKEELEKLIEQEATIYCGVEPVKLTKDCSVNKGLSESVFIDNKEGSGWLLCEDLYKTKEEAEFAKRFKNRTRTETLDLPTWEELQDKVKDLEDHHDYIIVFNSRFVMEYEKTFIDQIYLNQNQPPYERYNWNGNKEGYIEACEMALNLFLDKEPKESNDVPCPLQPLAEHDKQVRAEERKKVCREIMQVMGKLEQIGEDFSYLLK